MTSRPRSSVRARAAAGVLLSGLVAAVWVGWLLRQRSEGLRWLGPGVALPLVPFVYFSTELLFGRSVPDLARQWDSLAGWQRGLLGMLVVVGAFAITLVVALLMAHALQ